MEGRKVAMASVKVVNYSLGYSIPNKQFLFYYTLQGGSGTNQLFPTAEEFMALADMFGNEGPINFDTVGNYFVSAAKQV
jgi:hypothetical protein